MRVNFFNWTLCDEHRVFFYSDFIELADEGFRLLDFQRCRIAEFVMPGTLVGRPKGAYIDLNNDTIPATDWDLCEIWYATSVDGFSWEEQGVAIRRPPKPNVGWRSVETE